MPQTIIDDVAGGRLATAHLLGLGHRRIGFVGDATARREHDLGFGSSRRRLRGYRQELAGAGIDFDPELVRLGPHGPAVAAELADQLLRLPDPPTAIFAASDTQAMGVLSAAEHRGFGVPGRLSVVGFDDIESAALLNLSTVRQPLERSGAEGARRLCALLHGITVRPIRQLLPLRIMRRSSSAAPGITGPGTTGPGLTVPGLAGQGLASPGRAGPGQAGPDTPGKDSPRQDSAGRAADPRICSRQMLTAPRMGAAGQGRVHSGGYPTSSSAAATPAGWIGSRNGPASAKIRVAC